MVNALVPWGNHHLLPLGPLREPLTALCQADILVIHHADLVLILIDYVFLYSLFKPFKFPMIHSTER